MPEIDPVLIEMLKQAKEAGASDLHVAVATPPVIRVNSKLSPMEGQPRLMPPDTQKLLFSIMNDNDLKTLKDEGEVDLAFGLPEIGRFRVNIYRQRGSYAGAIRLMNAVVPEAEDIGVPESVIDLYSKKSGMVLVTGPTGSGKSTTLAAIIKKINEHRNAHVLTLEDPIEYLYRHDKSLVDQREIGLDSRNFATALRAALREDPDVIMVGEMRDLETISTAITAAETGHLVFSSLHTTSAAQTIDRIIDVFPEGQKDQVRTQLAQVLECVVSQRLVPRASGKGRIACFEVMHCTPAIRAMIRDNKTFQIPSTIQTSRKLGMITLDDALIEAVNRGDISKDSAIEFATDRTAMEAKFSPSIKPKDGGVFRW